MQIGNLVQFGPKDEGNFIKNVATSKKLLMITKGGSYVTLANFVALRDFRRQASNLWDHGHKTG